jgi:sn-glycerol 3-phosphate transport system substrate-binding protein
MIRSCLILAALFLGCFSASLQPASGADDPKSGPEVVRFRFGLGGTLGEAITAQAEKFNASHPEIRVEVTIHNGYGGTLADFRAARAAGDPPEIAVLEIHAVAMVASYGNIAPFMDLIRDDQDFDSEDVIEATLFNLRWKDQLYALPINRSTPILYYNKQRFQAAGLDPATPPRTWTEVREVARKLTTDPQRSYGLAITPSAWIFEALVFGAGGELMNVEQKRATFVTSGAKSLERWADMVHRDKTARVGGNGGEFFCGEAAMFIESTALLAAYESAVQGFQIGTGFVPYEEGQKPGVTTGGGAAVMPASLSPDKRRAALKFLKWLIATEQTAEFSRQTGYLPLRKSAVELLKKSDFYVQHPNYLTAVEQLEFAREAPALPSWSAAWPPIARAVTQCLQRDEPAEISLARAAQEIDRIFGNTAKKGK